jgi:hypothetical protein
VQGGVAFGYSVWLDQTFLGSWVGDAVNANYEDTFNFTGTGGLVSGSQHVITILQDHMGYEEDWWAGSDNFKTPRGILSYFFVGSSGTEISVWKLAGNLGGEDVSPLFSVVLIGEVTPRVVWQYVDTTRGPLNEGGLYGERMGKCVGLLWIVLSLTGPRKDGTSPNSLMTTGKKVHRPPEFPRLVLASTGQILPV